jgi:DNA repair protein RecO (recombination protein O)
MRISLQPAYVLHQRPYRETSLLLEVFSLEHGRVGVVARGVRRAKSPLRPLLQAFRPLLMSWSGRGELMSLVGAEAGGTIPCLKGRGLLSAFYVNELIMRLLHRSDPYPELYRMYESTLSGLARLDDEEAILRVFEKRLLATLGYGLSLDADAITGEPLRAGRRYRYLADQGPVGEAQEGMGGVLVDGEVLLALRREVLDAPDLLAQSKRLMRYVLRTYLGDKPLASRELFR